MNSDVIIYRSNIDEAVGLFKIWNLLILIYLTVMSSCLYHIIIIDTKIVVKMIFPIS